MIISPDTALVIIDVQRGFNDAKWGKRNNPEAETNIAQLLSTFRKAGLPVIHIQHDSVSETGAFRPGSLGHAAKPEAQPLEGEPIYHKRVNSGFIGTTLEADLRSRGITGLVITGLTTNHCVSTTTRMAGNYGFDTMIVSDATATFERIGLDGRMRSAEEVHFSALSDLAGEFAAVVSVQDVVNAVGELVR